MLAGRGDLVRSPQPALSALCLGSIRRAATAP